MDRSIEALEARIAPAAVFTYTEADGDIVTVKTSAKVSNQYFEGLATYDGNNLDSLDLSDPVFQNTNLTITVKKAGGGNGKASIGRIEASVDLKNVVIKGDLESIVAGDPNAVTAPLKKLQVNNLGDDSSVSSINGRVKQIRILGDYAGQIDATRIDTLRIGGSVLKDSDINASSIGSLVIGGDMGGQISAYTTIDSIRVAGDVRGEGDNGTVSAQTIKSIVIGKSIIGGDVSGNGSLEAFTIGKVVIRGDVIGGTADSTGRISANQIGSIRIGGNLEGGTASNAGYIEAAAGGSIGKLVIDGSVIGGAGEFSGSVLADAIGTAKVGKNVIGGDGSDSGHILGDKGISLVRVGGNLEGGPGTRSGVISTGDVNVNAAEDGDIQKLVISGSIVGGSGETAGAVMGAAIYSTSIGGSILGGSGILSGSVLGVSIGNVSVAGSVNGGSWLFAGSIIGISGIVSVKIGKDLSTNAPLGGLALFTGSILSTEGSIGSIAIGGDFSNTYAPAGIQAAKTLGSLKIGGNVTSSSYGPLVILAGSDHPASSAVPAIDSIKIKGDVSNLLIAAGLPVLLPTPPTTAASIGSVKVGGNFTTSTIAAGINAGPDGFYGTEDDTAVPAAPGVVSRIGSVVIGKSVIGSPGDPDDSYGIFAQHIESLKVNGVKQKLETGASNDLVAQLLGDTNDVRYGEFPINIQA